MSLTIWDDLPSATPFDYGYTAGPWYSREQNPYPVGSSAYWEWFKGWETRRAELAE